jgi:hypothetical protein
MTMSDVCENSVSTKSLSAGQADCRVVLRGRSLAIPGMALGLLLGALYMAPGALGQSQSGSSATAAQASADTPAKAQTQAPAQSQPQMQDQSAPPEQSLAEAARKAKADKAKSASGKVYTEEGLAGLSGHGVSSVGSGNSAGSALSGSGNSSVNSGTNAGPNVAKTDEDYWRGKAQAIRDQEAEMDKQIAGIQEEIKAKGAVTVDPMSGASAGVIYIEDRNAQIKQIEARKAKLQEQMEALAEEGRKAGADSGWFR